MASNAGAPSRPVLNVQNLVKGFGAQPVLRDVSLTIHEGDRVGLIGRNGSGKSTLLRIMAGVDTPDEGLVVPTQGLRVGWLAQACRLDPERTVGEVLEHASEAVRRLADDYHATLAQMARTGADMPEFARLQARAAEIHHRIDVAEGWNPAQQIKRIATVLNLPPFGQQVGTLSGGEARRVDLAATLLNRPNLLLLDEPTNQVDTAITEWLENYLAAYPGSCVLVTHDRYFLDRVANRIVELEFTRLLTFPGNYTRFLEYKTVRQEQEAREEAARLGMLRRELAWVRRGAKARTTKQKARLDRYATLEAQGPPPEHREFGFEIPSPKRLGKRVLEARSIARAYGEKVLFRDFSLIFQDGMRVGVVGPNGVGKTTLLRVLMGLEPPGRGEVVTGEHTVFLYIDQTHAEVDLDHTILKHVSNGQVHWPIGETRRVYVPAYLERFLFDRASVLMPMRNLSGGELGRVELARKLLRGGNFLVLDEPTNDLDLPTLRVLEEAIVSFEGCALIVSHDRFFLNRTCTHLLAFEGDGQVVLITGNYDDYLLYKEKTAAETGPAPQEKKPARPRATVPKPSGLTWKEKQELDGIEDAVYAAETETAALEALVATPEFYRNNGDTVRETLASLDAARARVDALYARWQELELRRDK